MSAPTLGGPSGNGPPSTANSGAPAPPPERRDNLTPFPKGVSGNPSGRPRDRLEALARLEAGRGVSLVAFWGRVFRGEPITMHITRLLPPQTRKQGTRRKRQYIVVEIPYYPTIEDMKWASEMLADRGWGKAPQRQDVSFVDDDGEGVRGFTILHRRWAPGVDPLANHERVIPGEGRVLPPAPGPSGNGGDPA